jgi:signal peptidase I
VFTSAKFKEATALLKGAQRVLNYEKDRAKTDDLKRLEEAMGSLKSTIKNRVNDRLAPDQEGVEAALKSFQPFYRNDGIRETVELILVAIVLALGIRTYYLQPFKIPTGSMQPTLNGVIAHRTSSASPNVLTQIAQFLILGRTYEDVVSPVDDTIVDITSARYRWIWDGSNIQMASGRQYLVGITPEVLEGQMAVVPGREVRAGQPVVRGYADIGDHLVVDMASYNFVGARRGDIFVFKTNRIVGIPANPERTSEHYIKRLAGVPGDKLRIAEPNLFINEHPAENFVFKRVESQQNRYTGYRNDDGGDSGAQPMIYLTTPNATVDIPTNQYFALGDNSANSLDSRYWGTVPRENVVGRGLFVYWPFTSHWGFVK